MSLNPKQQRFVEEYLKDSNATQAAIRAGYSKKTAQPQSARLLLNVIIKNAIKKAQKSLSERTEITQEVVIQKLKEIADANGKISVAVRAWELIGKNLGMFKERIEIVETPVVKVKWADESKDDRDTSSEAPQGAEDDLQTSEPL